MYVYIQLHTYVCVCIYVCMHAYMHVCIRIHIRIDPGIYVQMQQINMYMFSMQDLYIFRNHKNGSGKMPSIWLPRPFVMRDPTAANGSGYNFLDVPTGSIDAD